MTESGEFVHVVDVVAVPTHDVRDGEYSRSENCGEKSLRNWSKSKMDEIKSSAVVVMVSVVDGAAVAVLVVVVAISGAVAVVAVVLEVGMTPASPAGRGHPEVLNLWMEAFFEEEEEESVVKEAVLSK